MRKKDDFVTCPECGEIYVIDEPMCPYCGADNPEEKQENICKSKHYCATIVKRQ